MEPIPQTSFQDQILGRLRSVFHFDSLRPFQLNPMISFLQNQNVCVISPPSGGKSLIYQLTSLLFNGVTIVFCPYTASIGTQIAFLVSLRSTISAIHLQSFTKSFVIDLFQSGACPNLLYMTPEYYSTSAIHSFAGIFSQLSQQNRIRFVFDDCQLYFNANNKSFRNFEGAGTLQGIHQKYPTAPKLFLSKYLSTHTIPLLSQTFLRYLPPNGGDVEFGDLTTYSAPPIRTTHFYNTIECKNKMEILSQLAYHLTQSLGKALIFVETAKQVNQTVRYLKSKRFQNVSGFTRHIDKSNKSRILKQFGNFQPHSPRINILVATYCLSSNIHFENVRMVCVLFLPPSINELISCFDRGGRSGNSCQCILLWSQKHMDSRFLAGKLDILPVLQFCLVPQCLQNSLHSPAGHENICCSDHCSVCNKYSQNINGIQKVEKSNIYSPHSFTSVCIDIAQCLLKISTKRPNGLFSFRECLILLFNFPQKQLFKFKSMTQFKKLFLANELGNRGIFWNYTGFNETLHENETFKYKRHDYDSLVAINILKYLFYYVLIHCFPLKSRKKQLGRRINPIISVIGGGDDDDGDNGDDGDDNEIPPLTLTSSVLAPVPVASFPQPKSNYYQLQLFDFDLLNPTPFLQSLLSNNEDIVLLISPLSLKGTPTLSTQQVISKDIEIHNETIRAKSLRSLINLRNQLSDIDNIPPESILPTQQLFNLNSQLPRSINELSSQFSNEFINRYGNNFVEITKRYNALLKKNE